MKKALLLSLTLSTAITATFGMEPEAPTNLQIASAASSLIYKVKPDDLTLLGNYQSLNGYRVLKTRFVEEGSIQAMTLFNDNTNSAVVAYRGTKSANDWTANLGIGCVLANAVHQHELAKTDGTPLVRLPDYFSNLANQNLRGLFGDQAPALSTIDPYTSQMFDTLLSISAVKYVAGTDVKNATKRASAVTSATTGIGLGVGSIVPIVGTTAGGIAGLGLGCLYFAGDMAYTGCKLLKTSYNVTTDPNFERQLHIDALQNMTIPDTSGLLQLWSGQNILEPLKLYTTDAAKFLQDSVGIILNECNADRRPTITVSGHSLGRMLGAYAFLNYTGANNTHEADLAIDGIQYINHFGFNGPAGFQGLPHLPYMATELSDHQGNITQALQLLDRPGQDNGHMIHVRRRNDLVGNLGNDRDFAHVVELNDVQNTEGLTIPKLFKANHSMVRIMEDVHPK